MKRIALLMFMALILDPACPAEAFYKTMGPLEVYLHQGAFPECEFPLTKAEPTWRSMYRKAASSCPPSFPSGSP